VVRAVVFDFDGLILDTESAVYEAWAEVYRDHGQELSLEFWKGLIGFGSDRFDPIADLEARLDRRLDAAALLAGRRASERRLLEGMAPMPGVVAWRRDARRLGMGLGVASSSSRGWVTGHLANLGLDDWDCIRCGTDVTNAKPHPEVYLAVTDCLGCRPEDAIALEDSNPGLRAAKAAGLRCVVVPGPLTAGHDLGQADLVLESLEAAGLEEVLRRLGQRAGETR
jgi:HAD superfamily hydrolase (TIGR01509 family)